MIYGTLSMIKGLMDTIHNVSHNADTDFPSLVKRVSHHDILLELLSIIMGENI
jgi:hypothetical protein